MAGSSSSRQGSDSFPSFFHSSMEAQWADEDASMAAHLSRPTPRRFSGASDVPTQSQYTGASDVPPPNLVQGPTVVAHLCLPPPQYPQGPFHTSGPSYPHPSQYAHMFYSGGPGMPPSHFPNFGYHMGPGIPSDYVNPSSNSAFSMTSSHGEKGTNTGTGSSRKSSRRSEDEVGVSSPRKKCKGKGPKPKGNTNKVWLHDHDMALIPFLAEQARNGNKVDKTFKATAFNSAAAYINSNFNTDYTSQHVRNHMKGLKTRLADVELCFAISGAGWSEEEKMITLDNEIYEPWATV